MTIKPIQDLNPQPALARMCYSATVLHIDHGHHPLQTEAWLASEAGQLFPRFPESYLGSIGDQAPCEPLRLLRPGGSTITIITNFFQLL